jgi:hypothetical protein
VAALGVAVERPQEVVERARLRPGPQGLRLVPLGRPLLPQARARKVRAGSVAGRGPQVRTATRFSSTTRRA